MNPSSIGSHPNREACDERPDRASNRVVNRTVPPDPAFMQKYSGEVRARIVKKAYELYEQRGRLGGQAIDDWLQAEEIVMRKVHEAGE